MNRVLAWPFVALIRLYQLTVSRLFPSRCRFHPSCSQYAIDSLRLNGPVVGGVAAFWRLLRCGPWTDGGLDPARALLRRTRPAPETPSAPEVRPPRARQDQKLETNRLRMHG